MLAAIKWDVKWDLFWKAFADQKGYELVLVGLKNTVLIAVIGLILGVVIGSILAIVKLLPQYKWYIKLLGKICDLYVAIFRGTPMVVQLLVGYFVLVPLFGAKGVQALNVCIVIFGLNSGAYVSEIMRSGIMSVDPGQMEAGRALGLTHGKTMFTIVLPQAVKNILPTLGNEFITLIKETSIVSFVGAMDLYTTFSMIGGANYEYMIPYLFMACIYIVLVFLITVLVKFMERRFRKSDRRK